MKWQEYKCTCPKCKATCETILVTEDSEAWYIGYDCGCGWSSRMIKILKCNPNAGELKK